MMKIAKKVGLILPQLLSLFLVGTTAAHAISVSPVISPTEMTVSGVVNTIIQIVFGVGILVCVIFLVLYGIKYITAGDDVKKIEGARKGITGAVIGLAVIILTFGIIKFVAIFLGVGAGADLWEILPDSVDLSQ